MEQMQEMAQESYTIQDCHLSRPCNSCTPPDENGTLVLTAGTKVEVSVVPRV
jgi:hypothetical protein